MGIRLVVGLGNPGSKYRDTRHNVGFALTARLVEAAGWKDWQGLGEWGVREVDGRDLWCMRPSTFMNESGRAVRSFAAFHKVPPSDVLVCYGELDLPLGRIRLRPGGSSAGHRGMQSVIDHLGTQDVPRLRVGIGPLPAGRDGAGFVLGRFSAGERDAAAAALGRAAEAVLDAAARGVEHAMNAYNKAADGADADAGPRRAEPPPGGGA